MASAAAVAANLALTPERELGADTGVPGEVTSKVGASETHAGDVEAFDEEEDDDDEDVHTSRRRRDKPANGDVEDEPEAPGVDDLFGDDDDEELEELPEKHATRQLDDEELDSGDDMERGDRAPEEAAQEYETLEKTTAEVELSRQVGPEPSDGEMYLLRIPKFMEIEPTGWQLESFQPPTTDHHSSKLPSATFSAFDTALTTVRWRHSPSDAAKLQSNARILRWSDGSLTLQLASDPTIQYEINANPLAPPQRNPIKPTPTSIETDQKKAGRQGGRTSVGGKYDEKKDSFTYLVSPDQSTMTLRVTHKVTAGLTVERTQGGSDEAEHILQLALAHAANTTKVTGVDPSELKVIEEDPEHARKAAEKAMQDKAKAERKREAAATREHERSNRAFDRPSRYTGGLNVGMLEDEDEMGGGRSRAKAAPRKRRQRAHGSEYSSDEDYGRKKGNKEDEYDQEDDFLAPSDEEEEAGDEDEDEDDGIVEESSRRDRSPKRDRPESSTRANDDEDADGEPDEEVQQARTKRRRIVDDDDDDE